MLIKLLRFFVEISDGSCERLLLGTLEICFMKVFLQLFQCIVSMFVQTSMARKSENLGVSLLNYFLRPAKKLTALILSHVFWNSPVEVVLKEVFLIATPLIEKNTKRPAVNSRPGVI